MDGPTLFLNLNGQPLQTEQRPDPGELFQIVDGLGEHIVSTDIHPFHVALHLVESGPEDYWGLSGAGNGTARLGTLPDYRRTADGGLEISADDLSEGGTPRGGREG